MPGAGTAHIIVIKKPFIDPKAASTHAINAKARRLTINVAPRQLPQYICWTRPHPLVKTKIQDQRYPFERENAYKKNFIWIICRFLICSNQSINSWIGFNIITGNSNDLVVNKDTVRYLTKIDALATSMNTAVEILTNAKLIRVALQLESVITVFDQAIYVKATEILWENYSDGSFSYHHNAACNNWDLIWRSRLKRHRH